MASHPSFSSDHAQNSLILHTSATGGESLKAQNGVWSLFGTQTRAEPLFAPVLNVLFVCWKRSALPSPDISSSLGPLQGAQMRTAQTRNKYQSQSQRGIQENLNLGFCFKHHMMLSLAESSIGHATRTHVDGLRVWVHLWWGKKNKKQIRTLGIWRFSKTIPDS